MMSDFKEYERTIDGRDVLIFVEVLDYPKFSIDEIRDAETDEAVTLSADQMFNLYSDLSVDMAGDLADAASDYYDDR